jgi:hypothetical protein
MLVARRNSRGAPTLLVVPLIAQLRHSTWLAVMLHAGLSLPGFVMLGLGVEPR